MMPDAAWLVAFDKILERLGWAIWPLIAVGIAVVAMLIIRRLGGEQVTVLKTIAESLSATAVSTKVLAEELGRVGRRLDDHDKNEESRHRETLHAITDRRPPGRP